MLRLAFLTSFFLAFGRCSCPIGALQWKNSCYQFNSAEAGFVKAEGICTQNGGHLASIHDAFTNDFVGQNAPSFFKNNSVTDYWIGANSITLQDQWQWTDESPFNFADWAKGEPVSGSGINCASASMTDGYWSAQDCFSLKPFVCGVPNIDTTSTSLQSTPTPTTIMATTTMPTEVSTGNGFPVGNCSTGWTYFYKTHSFYCHFPTTTFDWTSGEICCKLIGSHLTSIHSVEENQFLLTLQPHQFWTGLQSVNGDALVWYWSDGTNADYLPWYIGEPISNNGGCAVLTDASSPTGVLQQTNCQQEWPIICKVPA